MTLLQAIEQVVELSKGSMMSTDFNEKQRRRLTSSPRVMALMNDRRCYSASV